LVVRTSSLLLSSYSPLTLHLYSIDPDPHTAISSPSSYAYFGSIVGRYANRISQSSFTSPDTNESFSLPVNEGDSTTLHGGLWGYSRSGWKVESHKEDEIVFSLLDQGSEGEMSFRFFNRNDH